MLSQCLFYPRAGDREREAKEENRGPPGAGRGTSLPILLWPWFMWAKFKEPLSDLPGRRSGEQQEPVRAWGERGIAVHPDVV